MKQHRRRQIAIKGHTTGGFFAMKKTDFFLDLLLVFLLMGFLFTGESTAAVSGRPIAVQDRLQNTISLPQEQRERKLENIVGVLESRIRNRRLPVKVLHKLSLMSYADFQLVSSLCDRMAKEGDSTGADIAFFLVTALIVVS
jgi:hypothetical protein